MQSGQVPDWPDELDEAAEQLGLGSMTVWNRADIRSTNRTASISMLVVAVIILVMGTGLAINDQREDGAWWHSSGVLGLGVAALVFGLVFLVKRGKAAWVCLFEQGLAWQTTGQDPITMRWSEVEEISRVDVAIYRNGVHQVTHHDTFVRGGGAVIPVTRIFPAVEDLTERIVGATASFMVPRMAHQIERGESVEFGALSLSSRGVSSDGRELAWSELAAVRLRKSEVHVVKTGERKPWATVNAVGLPNLAVLLMLADALGRTHRTSSDQKSQ